MSLSSARSTRPYRPIRWVRGAVPLLMLMAALVAFIAGVWAANHDTPFRADTTVAPCSAYVTTSHPHFDGPIVPGVCVTADGHLDTAP